jgi:hypothetical protein
VAMDRQFKILVYHPEESEISQDESAVYRSQKIEELVSKALPTSQLVSKGGFRKKNVILTHKMEETESFQEDLDDLKDELYKESLLDGIVIQFVGSDKNAFTSIDFPLDMQQFTHREIMELDFFRKVIWKEGMFQKV